MQLLLLLQELLLLELLLGFLFSSLRWGDGLRFLRRCLCLRCCGCGSRATLGLQCLLLLCLLLDGVASRILRGRGGSLRAFGLRFAGTLKLLLALLLLHLSLSLG